MARLDPKKIALSGLVLVSFAAYSLYMRSPGSEPKNTASKTSARPAASSQADSQAAPAKQMTKGYKDGEYIGSVADAFYGNIQVRITISGGRIVGIDFLQYPNDRPESTSINEQAMPFLQQEAIKSQNAHVDSVTGATDTSHAFEQSLAAALSKAM